VVVVGSSLAGLRVAQGLRSGGFGGAITLVGDEAHEPYDRPPLSKELLSGAFDVERTFLAPGDGLAKLDLDLRLGVRAVDLDLATRTVGLHGGARLDYDQLVVATGASARRLPGGPALDGVLTLRTLDDSLALKAALDAGPSQVVVVGAGFVGAEVAAAARAKGLPVVVLEALPVPLARGLGPTLGPAVAAIHARHGVDLRLGVAVESLEGDAAGHVERVVLSDGTTMAAELVLVGIGAVPNTAWLEGSGLDLADGVVCDEACRAVNAVDVWAAGDVARWTNPLFGESMRLEHWDNAARQGTAVADNIRAVLAGGEPAPFAPVPYVWSEQYDSMIQVVGRAAADDTVHVVHGGLEEPSFLAVVERAGSMVAAVGVNETRRTMRCRKLVGARPAIDDALAAVRAL
jgi:NADPH-dependent 2,4-dienoyl-CoA reductase/sulfur reductase-like enzyme